MFLFQKKKKKRKSIPLTMALGNITGHCIKMLTKLFLPFSLILSLYLGLYQYLGSVGCQISYLKRFTFATTNELKRTHINKSKLTIKLII